MAKVQLIKISEDEMGQRIDNYLLRHWKGVPKSRVYRALRSGEVRVNKSRVRPDYRLQEGDQLRLPPLRVSAVKPKVLSSKALMIELEMRILYEDSGLIVISKPSGIPVHGGTGVHTGLIEVLRQMRPLARTLELVHRLDRDTSGCLMVAKKRSVLVMVHDLLTRRQVDKRYLALVKGSMEKRIVELPLLKNTLRSGERMVTPSDQGKAAVTEFRPLMRFAEMTLVEVKPLTGRTHQIRVHAAAIGHPIAGDEKYGEKLFNQRMRKWGLKRLFLHSASVSFLDEKTKSTVGVCALLEEELSAVIKQLCSTARP